jgi:hypothetical protein
LRTLGFKAEPLSVYVEVERVDDRRVFIGISPNIPVPNAGRWYGHLVLMVTPLWEAPEGQAPHWIIDVTAGQFSSPQDGIAVPDCLLGEWTPVCPGDCETRTELYQPRRNLHITYWRRTDDDGGWRAEWDAADLTKDRASIHTLVDVTRAEFRRRAKFSHATSGPMAVVHEWLTDSRLVPSDLIPRMAR